MPPRRLNPSVPVDLETIVLAAMAKSRDERYRSAQALADDLERFLSGEPTLARRPGLVDRATKWARRHRALVAVAAVSVFVVSIVSSVGMVMLAREQARTKAAFAESEENRRLGQREFRPCRSTTSSRPATCSIGLACSWPTGWCERPAPNRCGGNCWSTRSASIANSSPRRPAIRSCSTNWRWRISSRA